MSTICELMVVVFPMTWRSPRTSTNLPLKVQVLFWFPEEEGDAIVLCGNADSPDCVCAVQGELVAVNIEAGSLDVEIPQGRSR